MLNVHGILVLMKVLMQNLVVDENEQRERTFSLERFV